MNKIPPLRPKHERAPAGSAASTGGPVSLPLAAIPVLTVRRSSRISGKGVPDSSSLPTLSVPGAESSSRAEFASSTARVDSELESPGAASAPRAELDSSEASSAPRGTLESRSSAAAPVATSVPLVASRSPAATSATPVALDSQAASSAPHVDLGIPLSTAAPAAATLPTALPAAAPSESHVPQGGSSSTVPAGAWEQALDDVRREVQAAREHADGRFASILSAIQTLSEQVQSAREASSAQSKGKGRAIE